jgi:hypothetical protein
MRGLLLFLLVLVVAFVALGFYQGWFRFSGNRVEVDKDKMKKDAEMAKEKAKELVEKFKTKTGSKEADLKTVTGTVTKVEPDEKQFTLTGPKDQKTVIHISDRSTILRDNQTVSLADLKAGDRVTVTYWPQGGKNEAAAVTIEPQLSD